MAEAKRMIALGVPPVLANEIAKQITEAGGGPTSVTTSQISDATALGRSVMTAGDQASARAAMGAGTSNLALGTTATTALAGNTALVTPTQLNARTLDPSSISGGDGTYSYFITKTGSNTAVTQVPVSQAAENNTIARRTADGRLPCKNGSNADDAATVGQLNGRLSAAQRTAINALTNTSTAADIVAALKAS
ncbi:hypothetical protein ACLBWS_05340 [Brucellaceae bacterium D45D]